MKSNKLLNIFKQGHIIVPLYIYKHLDNFKVNSDEFIFLMYLYNIGEEFVFDPNKISKDLGIDIKSVMIYITKLTDLNLISVNVLKNDRNITEEYLSLSSFYSKLSLLIMDDINNKEEDSSTIYEIIEQEFGRTLSPMEYEIIKAWIGNGVSEELIKEALRESVYNGVNNLRYVDKILFEWNKKGYKTKEDVLNNRNKPKESVEVFNYNWLEDDEEE